MKMKKIIALVAAVVMMFSLVGCGEISYDDITGDWTTKTVDGMTVEEYAASLGVDISQAATNMTIKDDDTIVSTSSAASQTLTYERRSNGIEVKEQGKDTILMSMTYDKDAKTFSYEVDLGGTKMKIVMEKGKADLTAPATDAAQ